MIQNITIVSVVDLVPDNAGSEFILGFMQNNDNNHDTEIFITTMELVTVNVNISAPRYTATSIFQQVTVTAGSVQQILLDTNLRMSGSAKDSKALYISADNNIVVYGVNKADHSTDAFLGLPINVLGTEYYAITNPNSQTQIMVIGVEDTTAVSITLPTTTGGNVDYGGTSYAAGSTITETVDRFDTLQIANTNNGGDLSGAHITSDKPIVAYSGNELTSIGSGASRDHIVEMWYPVERWGTEFITVPIPDRTVGDKFKFVASEGSTTVQITGDHTASFTLSNAGDIREEDIASTAYCRIVASKAIMAVQLVLSQQSSSEPSDPAMLVIPSIQQYSYSYTFSTPSYSQSGSSYINYLMIVIRDADQNGLLLDGSSISPSLTAISGTDYVGGYMNVAEGTHTIEHTSRIVFFGAYLYGRAPYETYAFPIGMRLGTINVVRTYTYMYFVCIRLLKNNFVSNKILNQN